MGKVEAYRETLRALDAWDDFLLSESGLPGPRGNIELARHEGMCRVFVSHLQVRAR